MTPDGASARPVTGADRRAQIVAAARHLLETEGAEALTIRRLGAAVGIRGPSIYKHVPDRAAIEDALTVVALTEQAEVIQHVPADFAALARAYRTWAVSRPHRHRLLNDRPLNRSRLPPGSRTGLPHR